MSESPAVLALTWEGDVRFNLIEGATYVYPVWKILSFKCSSFNVYWMFATATWINGKAEHMSDAMFGCNQFRKVRRTVRPMDAVWADLIVLSIRGQGMVSHQGLLE